MTEQIDTSRVSMLTFQDEEKEEELVKLENDTILYIEELKSNFLLNEELGRGTLLIFLLKNLIGTFGVVYKAVRANAPWDLVDEDNKKVYYAIKKILPVIPATMIALEVLIIDYLE